MKRARNVASFLLLIVVAVTGGLCFCEKAFAGSGSIGTIYWNDTVPSVGGGPSTPSSSCSGDALLHRLDCTGASWVYYQATSSYITNNPRFAPWNGVLNDQENCKGSKYTSCVRILPECAASVNGQPGGVWVYGNNMSGAALATMGGEPWDNFIMSGWGLKQPIGWRTYDYWGIDKIYKAPGGALGHTILGNSDNGGSEAGVPLYSTTGDYDSSYEGPLSEYQAAWEYVCNQSANASDPFCTAGRPTEIRAGTYMFCYSSGMGGTPSKYASRSKVVAGDAQAQTSVTDSFEATIAMKTVNSGQQVPITFSHSPFVTTDDGEKYGVSTVTSRYAYYIGEATGGIIVGAPTLLGSGFTGMRIGTEEVITASPANGINESGSANLTAPVVTYGANNYYSANGSIESSYKTETINFTFNKKGSYLLCEAYNVNDVSGNGTAVLPLGASAVKFGEPMSAACVKVDVAEVPVNYAGESAVKLGGNAEKVTTFARTDVAGSYVATANDAGSVSAGGNTTINFKHIGYADAGNLTNISENVLRTVEIDGVKYCFGAMVPNFSTVCTQLTNINDFFTVEPAVSSSLAAAVTGNTSAGTVGKTTADGKTWYYLDPRDGNGFTLQENLKITFKIAKKYKFCESLYVGVSGNFPHLTEVCAEVTVNDIPYAGESVVTVNDKNGNKISDAKTGIVATNDPSITDKPHGNDIVAYGATEVSDDTHQNNIKVQFDHNAYAGAPVNVPNVVNWDVERTMTVESGGKTITTVNSGASLGDNRFLIEGTTDQYYFWIRSDAGAAPAAPTSEEVQHKISGSNSTINEQKDGWYYIGKKDYLKTDKYDFMFYRAGTYKICEILSVAGNPLTKTCAQITVTGAQDFAALSNVAIRDSVNAADNGTHFATTGLITASGDPNSRKTVTGANGYTLGDATNGTAKIVFSHNAFAVLPATGITRAVTKTVEIEGVTSDPVALDSDTLAEYFTISAEYGALTNFGDTDARTGEEKYMDAWLYLQPRDYTDGANNYMVRDLLKVEFKKEGTYTFCEITNVNTKLALTKVCAKVTAEEVEQKYYGESEVVFLNTEDDYDGNVENISGNGYTDVVDTSTVATIKGEAEIGTYVKLGFAHNGYAVSAVPEASTDRYFEVKNKLYVVLPDGTIEDGFATNGTGYEFTTTNLDANTDAFTESVATEINGELSLYKANSLNYPLHVFSEGGDSEKKYIFTDYARVTFTEPGTYKVCQALDVDDVADLGNPLTTVCAEIVARDNRKYYGESLVWGEGASDSTEIVDSFETASVYANVYEGETIDVHFGHDAYTNVQVPYSATKEGYFPVAVSRNASYENDDGNGTDNGFSVSGHGYSISGGPELAYGSLDNAYAETAVSTDFGDLYKGAFNGSGGVPVEGNNYIYGNNLLVTLEKKGSYEFCEGLKVGDKVLTRVCVTVDVMERPVLTEGCAMWAKESYWNSFRTVGNTITGTTDVVTKIKNHSLTSGNFIGWQDEVTYAKPGDKVEWLHCYYPGAQYLYNKDATKLLTYDGHASHPTWLPGRVNWNDNRTFGTILADRWDNKINIYAKQDISENGVGGSRFEQRKRLEPAVYWTHDFANGLTAIQWMYDYFGTYDVSLNASKIGEDRNWIEVQLSLATSHYYTERIETTENTPTFAQQVNHGIHRWSCNPYCSKYCCICWRTCRHGNNYYTGTVSWDKRDSEAQLVVPYNYKNRATIQLDTGTQEQVYAGETVGVSDVSVVVGTRNNRTATGAEYATRVDDAKVRLLGFVVDKNVFDGYKETSWGNRSENYKSKSVSDCDLIDNAKQCAVLQKYDGNLNEQENMPDLGERRYINIVEGVNFNNEYNVFDASAGDYYCVAMAVFPYASALDNDANGDKATNKDGTKSWYISRPSCRIIAKKPSFQVWGGSIYSAGGVVANVYSIKHNLYKQYDGLNSTRITAYRPLVSTNSTNNTALFGSWVEQSIVTKSGGAELLPSGAAIGFNGELGNLQDVAGGFNSGEMTQESGAKATKTNADAWYCRRWVPLSIANSDCGGQITNGSGIEPKSYYSGYDARKALVEYWLEGHEGCDPSNIGDSCDYETPTGKHIYYNKDYTGNHDGLSNVFWDKIPNNTTIVVARNSSDVKIDKNIVYENESFNNIVEIPKVIIYAKNIVIDCSVSQINAILIAEETLNTCYLSGDDINKKPSEDAHIKERSVQLTINGAIVANKVLLNRTYGNGVGLYSDEPAEIINYDSSILLWGQSAANASQSDTLTTVYQRELSPRY